MYEKNNVMNSRERWLYIWIFQQRYQVKYFIVFRVHELAEKYGATMTQISLAWQLARRVISPIIGATKAKYFDDAVGTFNIKLTEDDITYLEELYVPHKIVGAL